MNMYRLSLLSKLCILQAGITNGDYEAAGFSGQLDVVTLDTYNESEGQTSDTTGQDIIRVTVPIITAVIVVLLVAIIILAAIL